jgi:hypothetical protein
MLESVTRNRLRVRRFYDTIREQLEDQPDFRLESTVADLESAREEGGRNRHVTTYMMGESHRRNMASQLEVLKHRLFDADSMKAKNFKLFPGTNRDATAEEIAEEINKALGRIEAGDFEVVEDDD